MLAAGTEGILAPGDIELVAIVITSKCGNFAILQKIKSDDQFLALLRQKKKTL